MTLRKARHGVAPRSAAAASREVPIVATRACSTTVAYADRNTVCPMITVVRPRGKSSQRNRTNKPTATTISGSTSRMTVVISSTARPRRDADRIQSDAVIATSSDNTVVASAIVRLVRKSSRILWSCNTSANHRVVKPPQPAKLESALNEFRNTMMIGRYSRSKTSGHPGAQPVAMSCHRMSSLPWLRAREITRKSVNTTMNEVASAAPNG